MATELQHEQQRAGGIHPRRARRRGPQCFGSYFDEKGGSCALGAVYEGVYHLPREHGKLIPDHLERLFRCLDEMTKRCPQGCSQAAAAGVDDRAPERRSSVVARTDRRVADESSGNRAGSKRESRTAPDVFPRPIQTSTQMEARRRRRSARAAVDEIPADEESLAAHRGAGVGRRRRSGAARGGRPRRTTRRTPRRWSRGRARRRPSAASSSIGWSAIATAGRRAGRRRRARARRARRSSGSSPRWRSLLRTTPFARRRSDACTTSKALSSVARHAARSADGARRGARIADPAELLNVALKTDHKDAGVAALERASSRTKRPSSRDARPGGRHGPRTRRSSSGRGP